MNISWSEIKPYENELPTNYADRIGRLYTDTVTAAFKKSNGQFFTPVSIAYFMGKQISVNKGFCLRIRSGMWNCHIIMCHD